MNKLIDPTDINTRVHPCGCVDRFLAYPQYGWNKFDRCEQHKDDER
jgi:hypothetical protein